MRPVVAILALMMMAGCQQETDVTGSTTNSCAINLFPSYNPKSLDQCLAVCSKCGRGTAVTCSTSCKLRGAG